MGIIWIDVTTTMNWNRPAVGILRVEQEMIKFALRSGKQVGFFTFDNREFNICSFEKVRDKVYFDYSIITKEKSAEIIKTPSTKAHLIGFSLRRIRNSFYFLMVSIYEFSMAFIHEDTYKKLNHMNHVRYESFKIRTKTKFQKFMNLFKKQENWKNETVIFTTNSLLSKFKDGDVIISIGLSWDHGTKFRDFYDLKKTTDIKVVSMCYDLIPIKFPNLFLSQENAANFECYYDKMTWASDVVLCISRSSQSDYIEWVREKFMPEPITDVVTLGSTIKDFDVSKLNKNVTELKEKYILFVSTIERRKNHESIIKAVQYLIEQHSNDIPQIIFVGMKGWGIDDMLNDYALNLDVQKYVKIFNHLGDDDLSYLYQNCQFFIYPSFYEGWGLPVAEGLTYGKFGICSQTSSIPEVGGDLLDYVYPYDVIGWANKIEYYSKHVDALNERERRIKNEFKAYTWENFGFQVFQAVDSVLEQN